MSDENTLEITSPEVQPNPELDQLKQSIDALERKNHELIGKLKKAKTVPEGVNVQELVDFKNKAEQNRLESEGKYTEARQALEQQFREATAEKDKRIAELEARVRELELITPAVSALADVVHDPDLILKTKLSSDQIAREADGTVVVVDGYQRTPVGEWAKSLPSWMQKQPKPQGSGAPSGRSSGDIPTGINNPFAPDNFNLTEQSRLYRTDRDLYDRLKAAAKR
nr:putative scaffold protein [uncultured Mediterranean phage uvMED]